ncbi:MAG: ATP synthase F1 subunit epsilon [Clostridia bacterium]|nr:ATP synthase F1 subunit epsilon [Clostridia bacterium]
MTPFELEILTPEKPFFRGECASMVVPSSDGMVGILAHHAPLTAAVRDGKIVFTLPDGTVRVCAVTRGMIRVDALRVRVLCESAISPEDIDVEKERMAMQEAELELRKKLSYEEYAASQLAFAKAINRLKVKQYAAMHTNL